MAAGKMPLFNQLVVATVWGHGGGVIAVMFRGGGGGGGGGCGYDVVAIIDLLAKVSHSLCRRKVKSAVPGGGGGGGGGLWICCCCCYWPFGQSIVLFSP